VTFEKQVYPEADHAFLNEQRPQVYREKDARDAWSKIVPFLKRHLR
jgi:carboxymethylenebutenolidase